MKMKTAEEPQAIESQENQVPSELETNKNKLTKEFSILLNTSFNKIQRLSVAILYFKRYKYIKRFFESLYDLECKKYNIILNMCILDNVSEIDINLNGVLDLRPEVISELSSFTDSENNKKIDEQLNDLKDRNKNYLIQSHIKELIDLNREFSIISIEINNLLKDFTLNELLQNGKTLYKLIEK